MKLYKYRDSPYTLFGYTRTKDDISGRIEFKISDIFKRDYVWIPYKNWFKRLFNMKSFYIGTFSPLHKDIKFNYQTGEVLWLLPNELIPARQKEVDELCEKSSAMMALRASGV